MSNPESTAESPNAACLDPFTESFDAVAALQAPLASFESALPTAHDCAIFRKAAPLNNITECNTVESAPYRILKPKEVVRPPPAPPHQVSGSKRTREEDEQHGLQRKAVPKYGILSKMHAKAIEKSGPLSLLERAVRLRLKVRVVIRETHEIRGEIRGGLVAFDKHFNMVVRHVEVRDFGKEVRRVRQLFARGENVVLVALVGGSVGRGVASVDTGR